jgi:hypothetical protein
MTAKAVHGYRYPVDGTTLLYKDGLVIENEDYIDLLYHIEGNEYICFSDGWTMFTSAANIGQESVLLVKIEPMEEYIGLNFVEIIN